MHGVLVIDKPAGPTSFDVVRRVRATLQAKKAGHTGTLDPLATGVLPICIGDATRLAGMILEGDKVYEARVRLGVETDTLDAAGKVTAEAPVPLLTAALIEQAMAPFRGTFLQTPPMYSAVKVAGRRLYELAREGEEVQREPRPVTVHELTLRDFSANELQLSVQASKGFFVRVLAYDIGRALGCGAHVVGLRRTRSGPFDLASALTLDALAELAQRGPEAIGSRLVSMRDALGMPEVVVNAEGARRVAHGVPLAAQAAAAGRVKVVGPDGRLLAVADALQGRLRYVRVLVGSG